MDKQSLVGFCQQNNRIVSLFGSEKNYFDSTLNEWYQVNVVPLQLFQNSSSWVLSKYATFLDPTTQKFLDTNHVWITHDQCVSQFYALMASPLHDYKMSRVGILMVKLGAHFKPVIVKISGREFCIEMKGCGSPIGKFPDLHSRKQAQTFNTFHVKVTGGLLEDEGVQEFQRLSLYDSMFNACIKPLGVISFEYLGKHFSVLLRLVPSSIRASYTKNEIFDRLNLTVEKQYFWMGTLQKRCLELDEPHFHTNLNLNNIVLTESGYELTDFIELMPLFQQNDISDYQKTIFPTVFMRSFLNQNNLISFLRVFIKNLGTEHISHEKLLTLNNSFLMNLKASYYDYVSTHGLNLAFIHQHIQSYYSYYPQSFFDMPLFEWLETVFLPDCYAKRSLLLYFKECSETLPRDIVDSLISYESIQPNKLTEQQKMCFEIFPKLERICQPKKKPKSLDELKINRQTFSNSFVLEYITVESVDQLSYMLEKLCSLIEQVEQVVKKKSISFPSEQELISFNKISSMNDCVTICYPFFYLIHSFIATEKLFLSHSLKLSNDSIKQCEIKKSIQYLDQLSKQVHSEIDELRNLFCRNKSHFLELFDWKANK